MAKDPNRTARLEVRISPDELAAVKHTAELEGRSLSDFVAVAAQNAARRTIEESHLIRLSGDDQARFADLLLNPPEPTHELKRAKDAHSRIVWPSR